MKPISKISILTAVALLMLVAFGCSDLLKEQPRAALTPNYYSTGAGLQSGLTYVYASFRYYFGTEGAMNTSVYGTDEFTHGQQVTNPPLNVYSTQLNSANGDITTPWNRAFGPINTCNGIIQLGHAAADLTVAQQTALIAEAKYLRAQWYFILATTFGDVTLDLGSGPLAFNTSPTNIATRAPIADVYAAIIKDLTEASVELPDKPSAQGHVFKGTALHLLAKAYLTRGWSSAAVSSDFQNAYNTATQLITNKATYGVSLQANYATVFAEGNEYNAEVLWQVDQIDNNKTFSDNTNGLGGDPGLAQNRSNYLFRMLYVTNMPGMIRDAANGRPFVRYKPTPYLLDVAFADKVNDTRYNKSFQTVWYCNSTTTLNPKWTAADVTAGAVTQKSVLGVLQPAVAGQSKLNTGDTAIFMVPNYLVAKFLPVKDKRSYVMFFPGVTGAANGQAYVTSPSTYFGALATSAFTNFAGVNMQNEYYPSLSKYNATQFRAGSPAGGDPNVSSVRPFIVHRFAETYLIAAEAAFKLGDVPNTIANLNIVRTRAAGTGGNVANITATTAADLAAGGIDYILDERARELAGEQMRWFDLVRTQRLLPRMALYSNFPPSPGVWSLAGALTGAAANIPAPQLFHMLRPIPQNQIDGAVDPNGLEDPITGVKKYKQNPGY